MTQVVVENTKIWKKHEFFSVKKKFGLVFLILSKVTNFRGRFIRVRKEFWQLLWKLYDHFCNTKEVVANTTFWKKSQFFQWKKMF